LFELFVTTKENRLGLGLSISAANNPDRGATFTITLPREVPSGLRPSAAHTLRRGLTRLGCHFLEVVCSWERLALISTQALPAGWHREADVLAALVSFRYRPVGDLRYSLSHGRLKRSTSPRAEIIAPDAVAPLLQEPAFVALATDHVAIARARHAMLAAY
jgi:hypothetical protein